MYAEVAINAPVTGTFHYHIPPELDGKIQSGSLVQVAFGTAMQPGIVVALDEHSPVEETKPILDLLDPDPVMTPQQIDLARWMSRAYLAPLGACMWLWLPPGIVGKRDKRVTLIYPDAQGRDSLQQAIIDRLKQRGTQRIDQLVQSTRDREGTVKAVEKLVKQGIVETQSILTKPKVRPKQVQTAQLGIHPDQIPHIARRLGKSSKQADLLEVIATRPEDPFPIDEALTLADTTRATLNKLIDADYVFIEQTERGESDLIFLNIPPESVDEVLIDMRGGYKQRHILDVLSRESGAVDVSAIYAQTGTTLSDLKKLAEARLVRLGEKREIRDSLDDELFIPLVAPPLTHEQQAVWQVIEARMKGWSFDKPDVLNLASNPHLNPSPDSNPHRPASLSTSPVDRGGQSSARGEGDEFSASSTSEGEKKSTTRDLAPSPSTGRVGEGLFREGWVTDRWKSPSHVWKFLKPLAQQMRHDPTPAEKTLWQQLRRKQMGGYRFRRQHGIERFIVDFYCPEANLVVEIDGEIHQYTAAEDAIRQEFLEYNGLHILRFSNETVMEDIDSVLHEIEAALQSLTANMPIEETPADSMQPTENPPLNSGEVDGEAGRRGLEAGEGSRETNAFLLHGVTGSGKTEIYLRAIELTLAQGRQAIFLVPEIALTAQTVRRVAERFPDQVAVVHGGLPAGERYDTWQRAREGKIQIVVGARSGLFTPFPDVGLVILDEEHDHSYKQSPPIAQPHYHARDVAERMMRDNDGVLILGSATPDIHSTYRAQAGELTYLHLPNRIMGHRHRILQLSQQEGVEARYYPSSAEEAVTIDLPPVSVVDMRDELKAGNVSMFSRELQTALETVLDNNEQAMLYLNRRGQSTYVFCRDCGYIAGCPRCDTPLTYHSYGDVLRCHHCGHIEPSPQTCPSCSSRRIKYFGAGTQQVQEEVRRVFPLARVIRWDADTATKHDEHSAILHRFIKREADVLVGTQMIAKGLDLPLVTLVGVVSADLGLALPDFRAAERTFQLLMQVAGRAGRGLLGGKVVLQTYQPKHYAVQAAAQHDYAGFYEQEIAKRQDIGYPPFRRLVRILCQYDTEHEAHKEAEIAAQMLRARLKKLRLTGTELIGPAPCFFPRLDKRYRWHVLLRGPNPSIAVAGIDMRKGWYLDIDPVDVL